MKKVVMLFLCLLAMVLVACEKAKVDQPTKSGQQKNVEPYAFKDFKLGMTLNDFNILDIDARKADRDGKAYRWMPTTIGGAEGKLGLVFEEFSQGIQLVYMSITIPKRSFSNAREALIDKFGKPHKISQIAKSNAMGAVFKGDKLVWDNGVSMITAEEVGNKIDESLISFIHQNAEQSTKQREEEAKRKKDI